MKTTFLTLFFLALAVLAFAQEAKQPPQAPQAPLQFTVTLTDQEWAYIINIMESAPTVSKVWTPIKNRMFAQITEQSKPKEAKKEDPKEPEKKN